MFKVGDIVVTELQGTGCIEEKVWGDYPYSVCFLVRFDDCDIPSPLMIYSSDLKPFDINELIQ